MEIAVALVLLLAAVGLGAWVLRGRAPAVAPAEAPTVAAVAPAPAPPEPPPLPPLSWPPPGLDRATAAIVYQGVRERLSRGERREAQDELSEWARVDPATAARLVEAIGVGALGRPADEEFDREPVADVDDDVLLAEVRQVRKRAGLLPAVSLLAHRGGLSLAQAKAVIDDLDTGTLDVRTPPPPPPVGVPTGLMPARLDAEVSALLRSQGKIAAVRRVREVLGCGLAEAKARVDLVEQRQATGLG